MSYSRYDQLSEFHRKLDEGQFMTGLACALGNPGVVEVACNTGHDFVIVDAEHVATDQQQLENLIRAADIYRVPCLVKLADITELSIRNAFDFGACGIMCPHIRTPDELARVLEYTYFPPRGHRGLCGVARVNAHSAMDIREVVRWTNELALVVPIIEDREALEHLEDIIRVDSRIKVYEIGPLDLALSMGVDLDRSITDPAPELREAIDHIIGTLKAHGRRVLYPTRFPNVKADAATVAAELRSLGADLLYGIDTHALVRGARDLASIKRALQNS